MPTESGEYLLSEEILDQIERNPGYFPSRSRLRAFVKQRFNQGFKNEFVSNAKFGTPTPGRFLEHLLIYWKDEAPEFASSCLKEDWEALSEEDLISRHIRAVPVDYAPPQRNRDLIGLGPTVNVMHLLPRASEHGKPGLFDQNDLHEAAKLLVLAVGDQISGEPRPPIKEALKVGLESLGMTMEDVIEMVAGWTEFFPEAVYLKRDRSGSRNKLTVVLPLSDLAYDLLLNGEIDANEILKHEPVQRSSKLLLLVQAGDTRERTDPIMRELLFMTFRQLSILGKPITEEGMTVLSAAVPNGSASDRLHSWGFAPTGSCMKRSGFPLHQIELTKKPRMGSKKMLLWCVIVTYQTARSVFSIG